MVYCNFNDKSNFVQMYTICFAGGKSSKNNSADKVVRGVIDPRYGGPGGDAFQRGGAVVSTKNCDIIRTPCK